MTEKRFTIFGEWHKDCVIDEIRDNTGEYVTIGRVVDLLNENEQLKKQLQSEHQMLDNAILLERTRMGQSALKQYKEAIQ